MTNRYNIKFNREWVKLNHFDLESDFKLLWVIKTFRDVIPDSFVEYDTEDNMQVPFELPEGALILLILEQFAKLVTTVRRYTPRKYDFYKGLEGQNVGVEIVLRDDIK